MQICDRGKACLTNIWLNRFNSNFFSFLSESRETKPNFIFFLGKKLFKNFPMEFDYEKKTGKFVRQWRPTFLNFPSFHFQLSKTCLFPTLPFPVYLSYLSRFTGEIHRVRFGYYLSRPCFSKRDSYVFQLSIIKKKLIIRLGETTSIRSSLFCRNILFQGCNWIPLIKPNPRRELFILVFVEFSRCRAVGREPEKTFILRFLLDKVSAWPSPSPGN